MKEAFIFLLKFYKKWASPFFEIVFGKACRFTPSCSEYTITALEKFGTAKGLLMGVKRLGKCQPWGGDGYDPVPTQI
jgi:putative membrane protein insertion efficiency factor